MTKTRKRLLLTLIAAAILIIGVIAFSITQSSAPTPPKKAERPAKTVEPEKPAPEPAGFNKAALSIADPASLWVIVNKRRGLMPYNYAPADLVTPNVPLRSNITSTERLLRAEPAAALEKMVSEAASAGVNLNLQSGYRPYEQQTAVYNNYVRTQGQAVADSQSARPGYSEHQTGLAADLGGTSNPACNVEQCYGETVEGKWLAANAHRYGFVVRYQQSTQDVVGYIYEPWHMRYVGTELAAEINAQSNPPLETFFGTGPAPSYN